CRNGLVMVLGSGIGGGIIIDGKVLRGQHFFAGELSYLCTNIKDYKNHQSMFGVGCSSVSMINKIKAAKNIEDENFDGYQAFELIHEGDEQAVAVFEEVTKSLALELYNLQVLLDMEVVAIGGGISRQPILIETIKKNWDHILEELPYHKYSSYMPQAEVKACEFTSDANLVGALYSYLNQYKQMK
ncbi:ROK family protein, partial [Lachnotalea glycerini]